VLTSHQRRQDPVLLQRSGDEALPSDSNRTFWKGAPCICHLPVVGYARLIYTHTHHTDVVFITATCSRLAYSGNDVAFINKITLRRTRILMG